MVFRGSFVAIVTPFHPKGSIHKELLEELVLWHIEQGTDGLVCAGTTGEGITLSDRERIRVAQICCKAAEGKIPIVVGTGTADTKQSVRLTKEAKEVGAAGCLVVTPYYNKPSPRGCLAHFHEIAKVGLPIIAYHNPGRTAIRWSEETVREILSIPGVVAMKESGGDLSLMEALSGLPIFAGDDDKTYPILKKGGIGSISVIGNIVPRAWKKLHVLCLEERWEEAMGLFSLYQPLCKALFLETNPQGVKWAMHYLGLCPPTLRLPLVEPSSKTREAIREEILRLSLPCYANRFLPI